MDFGNKIRRMAEKKQWEKLRGCFDGCEEERRNGGGGMRQLRRHGSL